MSPAQPVLAPAVVERLSQVIGDTYTGSQIHRLLDEANISVPKGASTTKWRMMDAALMARQRRDKASNAVLHFVECCATPARFQGDDARYSELLDSLNEVLVFAGLMVAATGKVESSQSARTLDEAAKRVERITTELRRRSIHPEVMRCCEKELLHKNLFHGVQEGTKSAFGRLRIAVESGLDGATLVDHCFGATDGSPRVAINAFQTESEKTAHKGLASMLKGAYGMWRSPTAHSLRVETALLERDVIDALTTLSYIHRRLDDAVCTATGNKV